MGRTTRALAAGALVVLPVVATGGVAGAQRVPRGTATTTTTTASQSQAASSHLVRESDLPKGYEFDSGTPRTITGVSARYPAVDECVLNPNVPLSGLVPTTYVATFANGSGGVGTETIWAFSDITTAKAQYANVAKAFAAMPKCKVVTQDVTQNGTTTSVDVGTYEKLAVGSLGDERSGVSIDPAKGNRAPPGNFAAFRDGSSVVLVTVGDAKLSTSKFKKLAKTAATRESAA